jgi:hypothetical protein
MQNKAQEDILDICIHRYRQFCIILKLYQVRQLVASNQLLGRRETGFADSDLNGCR